MECLKALNLWAFNIPIPKTTWIGSVNSFKVLKKNLSFWTFKLWKIFFENFCKFSIITFEEYRLVPNMSFSKKIMPPSPYTKLFWYQIWPFKSYNRKCKNITKEIFFKTVFKIQKGKFLDVFWHFSYLHTWFLRTFLMSYIFK